MQLKVKEILQDLIHYIPVLWKKNIKKNETGSMTQSACRNEVRGDTNLMSEISEDFGAWSLSIAILASWLLQKVLVLSHFLAEFSTPLDNNISSLFKLSFSLVSCFMFVLICCQYDLKEDSSCVYTYLPLLYDLIPVFELTYHLYYEELNRIWLQPARISGLYWLTSEEILYGHKTHLSFHMSDCCWIPCPVVEIHIWRRTQIHS